MKRKLFGILLAALLALSCMSVFAACGDMLTADNGGNGDDTTIVTPGGPDDDPDTPGDPDEEPVTPPKEDDSETPHEHTYTSEVTREPSCEQEGETTYTCTCGDSYTESIPMTAHNYAGGACNVCGDPEPESTEGLVFELYDDGTQYAVTGYTGTATEVHVPSVHEGLPVTSIGNSAFSYCIGLTSIEIPDSITRIGWGAFGACVSLTSITIPAGVTSIGVGAFMLCGYSLENITVANGNPIYHSAGNCLIETESKTLLLGCENSVIPADGSVTSIEGYAFAGCIGLTDITIPAGVTSIGSEIFTSCSSLASITVASGNPVYHSAGNCLIETESKTLIAGCKDSVIPTDGSVTRIGNSAFQNCNSLTSIEIPDSITRIGEDAFCGCINLTSITIADSVTSIGVLAFSDCSSLTSVTFEDPYGWYASGFFVGDDLADPSTAAEYLTDTYGDCYWYKR